MLIIDEFGIQPLDQPGRTILMEIIEDRHGKKSTLFTSPVPVIQSYEVIGEQTIADAILDCKPECLTKLISNNVSHVFLVDLSERLINYCN